MRILIATAAAITALATSASAENPQRVYSYTERVENLAQACAALPRDREQEQCLEDYNLVVIDPDLDNVGRDYSLNNDVSRRADYEDD